MAAKAHIRSNSLPSRTHPVIDTVQEQLVRVRSSEAASSSSSASAVCQKLAALKDLHDSIDDWLQLSQTQQILSNQNLSKCVEDLLEGSLKALDVCGILREAISQMKECIQELNSSFRRKRGSDSGLASEVSSYFMSRKAMKKLVSRTLDVLKKMEKQSNKKKACEEKDEASLDVLSETQQMTISAFESLFRFLCKPKTKSSGWSVVSKVMSSKRISWEAMVNADDLESLDHELLTLKSGNSNSIQVNDSQKRAETLESVIRETEEVLECIFRCLLKTRVSLLNIVSH